MCNEFKAAFVLWALHWCSGFDSSELSFVMHSVNNYAVVLSILTMLWSLHTLWSCTSVNVKCYLFVAVLLWTITIWALCKSMFSVMIFCTTKRIAWLTWVISQQLAWHEKKHVKNKPTAGMAWHVLLALSLIVIMYCSWSLGTLTSVSVIK